MEFSVIYGIPFTAGLISFLSPCIIPMITVYISLITGISVESLLEMDSISRFRKGILQNTLFFIIGFTVIFVLAGSAAGLFGKVLGRYLRVWELVGGIFVVLFGLKLTGLLKLPFLDKNPLSRKFSLERKPLGIFGALLVGFFFALVCSHCIGPMLYSALIYSGVLSSPELGAMSMLSFSLGLSIPYFFTAIFLSFTLAQLKRAKTGIRVLNITSGFILIIFGLLMLSGKFTQLSDFLSKILPYKLPVGM